MLLHASDDDDHLLNSYFNHGVSKRKIKGWLVGLFVSFETNTKHGNWKTILQLPLHLSTEYIDWWQGHRF